MTDKILWDSEDEEEGLVQKLNQTYKSYPAKHFRQSAQQPHIQWEQQPVSRESFTKGITYPPQQLNNTIKKNTEIIRSSASSTSQWNSHHSANIFERMEPFSQEVRTDIEPKSAVLLIENPMTSLQIQRKALLQRIARRNEFEKRMQDSRKEYLAKIKDQIISHAKAQIKYLDDKRQERRKERQARYSQGSFMQAIRQLFNFSKQDKKRTQ